METQNRSNFEDSWKRAMDGAEIAPDPGVWENIEYRLDNPGNRAKHIFLIKFAIAASFLFAMTTAGLYMYDKESPIQTDLGISLQENITPGQNDMPVQERNTAVAEKENNDDMKAARKTALAASPRLDSNPSLWQDALQLGEASISQFSHQAAGLLDGLGFDIFNPDSPKSANIHRVPVYTAVPGSKSSGGWASMNIAGGGAGMSSSEAVAVYQVADFENLNSSKFVSRTETETPQSSVLFGIGFGKNIGKRWVLQSGVNYAVRKATGSSNVVTEANSVALDIKSSSAIASTEPYAVEHRLTYVTVPVQAGYRVIDRKLNVTVLAGLAGDIRMSHKVSDADGELNSIRLDEESNFNKYAASALVTAEISYPLGDHYRISAYPQLRQYLSPLQED
ncbi:MAG: outer membrane beta-barrel protein, partial [Cyclobacteriaceae bacterium]